MQPTLVHSAAALVAVPAVEAFDFLADPLRLGEWSLGCMATRPTDTPGTYAGTSLFDGSEGFFAREADSERLLVDYRVGPADAMRPRIMARVTPGPVLGRSPRECVVTLVAWRTADMSDERWARLCATHEVEVHLIKAQIESRRR